MKNILLLVCCLMMTTQIFSETINNVSYYLPAGAEDWKLDNSPKNEKGVNKKEIIMTTRIYVPKGHDRDNRTEFFGVMTSPLFFNKDDTTTNALLRKILPNMDVDFHVLEKTADSAIYEWSAREEGKEKAHGWVRTMTNDKDGTVVLYYQTENLVNLGRTRGIWLAVLRQASYNQKPTPLQPSSSKHR